MKIIFLYSVKEKLMGVDSEEGWVVSIQLNIFMCIVYIGVLTVSARMPGHPPTLHPKQQGP